MVDDKTAPIPSLKDFRENRKERSAQSARTGTMQTRGQMKKSAGRPHNTPCKQGARGPVKPSQPTMKKGPDAQVPSRRQGASTAQRRTGASAPRTYARERYERERENPGSRAQRGDYDSSRRVERTAQTNKKQNAQTRGGADRRVSSSKNTQTRRTSHPQKPVQKKPKKPLSPGARKLRSIAVSALIVLVVLIAGAILSLTVLFKTEVINVSGAGAYSKQDIISASGLKLGDNIFTSPKGRAEDKLEKKYPYIESADIYSVFPNAINIDITLADPAYVIEGLGGFYIVSDKGKVLEVSSTDDEADIPIIEGVTVEGKPAGEFIEYDSELIGTALEELFAAFRLMNSEKITAINIEADGDSFSMKYVYDNRIVVYLGIPEHIEYKVQTADTIIKEKIDIGGSMIAGDLDVSMCYDTMKSYFNQYTLLSPNDSLTQPATEETTQAETQVEYY